MISASLVMTLTFPSTFHSNTKVPLRVSSIIYGGFTLKEVLFI